MYVYDTPRYVSMQVGISIPSVEMESMGFDVDELDHIFDDDSVMLFFFSASKESSRIDARDLKDNDIFDMFENRFKAKAAKLELDLNKNKILTIKRLLQLSYNDY